MEETKPDEATSHGIALKFTELFQQNYPIKSGAIDLMEMLRIDIDNLLQSRIKELEKEKEIREKQTTIPPSIGNPAFH